MLRCGRVITSNGVDLYDNDDYCRTARFLNFGRVNYSPWEAHFRCSHYHGVATLAEVFVPLILILPFYSIILFVVM